MESPVSSPSTQRGAPDQRRGFIAKVAAAVIGGISLLVPAVTALVAYFNPIRQKSPGGEFFRLTALAALPEDGTPRRFSVITDRVDAWNRYPREPIGAVWLRRTGDKDKPVAAFQVVCPHAGCIIGLDSTPDGPRFFCPCHVAGFDLEGRRTDRPSPSPRDMDALEVEIRGDSDVWVKFENFVTGTSEKVAES
ncbi:MAG: Rieske 2Fe-2S domain-containing protein [Thermoguttaceae bacterium]|jgi:Rieske Fe-S protein|nr:Rieske 2Fe-2S domain-containing protein [Thermoguttaceae bacterium]